MNTPMQAITLLPCPFCGETPELTKHHRHDMWCMIHRCQIVGPITWDFTENPERIALQWNTRISGQRK